MDHEANERIYLSSAFINSQHDDQPASNFAVGLQHAIEAENVCWSGLANELICCLDAAKTTHSVSFNSPV
jgi:hypothetical protein